VRYPPDMTASGGAPPTNGSSRLASLRSRLVAIAAGGNGAPLVVVALAAAACSRGSDGGVGANAPIRPSHPPQPFDERSAAAPSTTSSATAGTSATASATAPPPVAGGGLAPCGLTFFVHKNPLATGGPYRLPACYTPIGKGPTAGRTADEVCLPASSPRLVSAIPAVAYASCVERGPVLEPPSPAPGAAGAGARGDCCYVFGAMGEGRPLWVRLDLADDLREARVSPRGAPSARGDEGADRSTARTRLVRVVAKLAPIAWVSQNPAGVSPLS
jgi:hypothetical protein